MWVNVDGCGGRISRVIICGATVVSGGVISGVVKDEIILDGEREFPVWGWVDIVGVRLVHCNGYYTVIEISITINRISCNGINITIH